MEAQSWWTGGIRTPGLRSHHVHLGACFPQGRTWRPSGRGLVRLDFRVEFHRMYGFRGYQLRGGIGCCDEGAPTFRKRVRLRCRRTNCTWWVRKYLDTDSIRTDGRKEARFSLLIRTNRGKRMFESTGWQSKFSRPGIRTVRNYRDEDSATARGWYEGFGYANAGITLYRAPGPRLHGIWRPRLKLQPGADGFPVTSYSVRVDARAHGSRPGILVRRGRGEFRGRVRINTRRLRNGMHYLVLVSNARRIRAGDGVLDGTNTGVLRIPFFVAN